MALEYLSGGILDTALQQLKAAGQGLSLEQALDYAVQIAEALAHAHGVIHRDIKTANMLFTFTPRRPESYTRLHSTWAQSW